MKLIRLLNIHAPKEALCVMIMSIIYGVVSGLFAPVLLIVISHIVAGDAYFIWLSLLIGCIIMQLVSCWIADTWTAQISVQILEKLVIDISETLRRDKLADFEKRNHAEIRIILEDAKNISEGAILSIKTFQNMIAVMVIWLCIFKISNASGIVFLCIYMTMFLVYEVVQKLNREMFAQHSVLENQMFNAFHNFLDGFKEIRMDARKNDDLFTHFFKPIIRQSKALKKILALIDTDYLLCFYAALFILLGTYVFVLPEFFNTLSIMPLIACTLYAVKPSAIALLSLPKIAMGQVALARLEALLAKNSQNKWINENIYNPDKFTFDTFHTLSLKDISFSYIEPDGSPGFSVGPITLNLHAGEILFISGGNGSGKSTLVKLLSGLYSPSLGTVSIDGDDIDLSDHTYLFSAIFTDFHLFDSLYGIENPDENLIHELLIKMQLDKKTKYYNGHFSALNLSAGQRRRLALVASLPEDKLIYIFDEWAADQDPHFRRHFYEELLPSMKRSGKTIVVITHDEMYYHMADRKIVMKDGIITKELNPYPNGKSQTSPHSNDQPSFFDIHSDSIAPDEVIHKYPDLKKQRLNQVETPDLSFFQYLPILKKMGMLAVANGACTVLIMFVLFKAAGDLSSKVQCFFLFIVSMLCSFVFTRFFRKLLSDIVEDVSGTIKLVIVDHVRKIALPFFEKIGVGRIYTSLTSDMNVLTNAFILLVSTSDHFIRSFFLVGYFAFLAFPIFVICLIVNVVIGVFFLQNQLRIKHTVEALQDKEIQFFGAITHLLSGFKELRLNDQKNDAFFHKSIKVIAANVSALRLKLSGHLIINTMLVYGAWATLLGLVPLMYPFVNISEQTLFMCVGIIAFLPINVLVLLIPPVTLGIESGRRTRDLIKIFDEADHDIIVESSESHRKDFATLQCQNLMFKYINQNSDDNFFVGPMNLRLRAGELIYITGGNGSGKSTLIKLITGLYVPDSGQILLNGQVTDIRLHRHLFSVIFSDFHLFDRLYGMPDADENKVKKLLHLMQLEQKVDFSGGKFSTTNLSTGQKKRLALVIAMMEDSPIYIFDEWAAEQDPYFRQYFYETILPGFKSDGKTVIAITHHDQYFHLADRVVKMEYGQVV